MNHLAPSPEQPEDPSEGTEPIPLDEQVDRHGHWAERREERRSRRRGRRRRFMERHEARMRRRREGNERFYVRPMRIFAGVLLILVGVAIGWLPGPGFIIFALPGAFLLASEIRRAALLMDRLENETVPRARKYWAGIRGGPRVAWVRDDPEFWAEWCHSRAVRMPAPWGRRSTDRQPGQRAAGGADQQRDD